MGTVTTVKKGQVLNYDYTGGVQSITLPVGRYKLEVWGAQGGNYDTNYGGAGGYSVGTLTLTEVTDFYIYVGGQPATYTNTGIAFSGGYNGGGKGYNRSYSITTYGQGGGGGTDIRIGQDSLYARVIVAGGGGGSASNGDEKAIKYGGGLKGGCSLTGYAGSQTSAGTYGNPGSFGKGGDTYAAGSNYRYGSGGGGGGWYGGAAIQSYSDSDSDSFRPANGGGSGYVYTADTVTNYPSGCLLNSIYYLTEATTVGGNESFPSASGGTEVGHEGNGYARITVLSLPSSISAPVCVDGQWHDCNEIFVKVNGVWKACESAYVKIGGVWKECIENTISNVTTYELSKFGSYVNTVKVNGTAVTLPIQVAAGATVEVTSTGYDASAYSMIWSGPTPTSNRTASSSSTTTRIVTFIMPSEDIIIRFNRQTVQTTGYTITVSDNVGSVQVNGNSATGTSILASNGDAITVVSTFYNGNTASMTFSSIPSVTTTSNTATTGTRAKRTVKFTMPATNITVKFTKGSGAIS